MDINARGVGWDMDSGMEGARVEKDFNVGFMDRDDIIAVA